MVQLPEDLLNAMLDYVLANIGYFAMFQESPNPNTSSAEYWRYMVDLARASLTTFYSNPLLDVLAEMMLIALSGVLCRPLLIGQVDSRRPWHDSTIICGSKRRRHGGHRRNTSMALATLPEGMVSIRAGKANTEGTQRG
jgi:hypothetical protein